MVVCLMKQFEILVTSRSNSTQLSTMMIEKWVDQFESTETAVAWLEKIVFTMSNQIDELPPNVCDVVEGDTADMCGG